jgi:hypothetical protein
LGFDAADTTQALAAQTARRRFRFQGELGRRSTEAISSGLIGGAFPLLFGQGIGAAIGGGAGGLGGGALGGQFGFGLSLVGNAIGAAFDEALNKGKALAAGLDDPIGKFEELRAAALFSSSATEKQISALISQGREAEAAAQIQIDLLRTYGDTTDLDGLKTAYDELGRAFNQLSVVTAKFVAGPLSAFLTKLSNALGAQAARGLLNERIESLGINEEGRAQIIAQARENIGTTPGLTLAQRAVALYEEANRLLDERYGKQQKVLDAEQRLRDAADRQLRIEELRTGLVDARARGEERRAITIQKELTDLERQQAISAAPTERQAGIDTKARQDQEQLTADLLKLDRDRLATSTLQIAQFRLQSTELERQFQQAQRIAAIGTGAGVTVARDNARFIGGLDEQIRQARQAEADIAAQISAEQLRGGDQAAQRIAELGRQQVTAAQTTRNLIFEAATQLRDAGQQLARNLRDAVTNFTAIRSDPQGLNRFLSPQAQANRAQGDFRLLLPQFRNAQAQFERLTGERAPEFTGTTAGVNAAIRDFINAVSAEDVAQQVLIQTNEALALTNEKLVTAQTNLAVVTAALVDKDWNVQVLVNGAPSPIPLPAGGLP